MEKKVTKCNMSREIRRFDISFKNPSANFGVGDVVAGNVNLDNAQDIKLKGKTSYPYAVLTRKGTERKIYKIVFY